MRARSTSIGTSLGAGFSCGPARGGGSPRRLGMTGEGDRPDALSLERETGTDDRLTAEPPPPRDDALTALRADLGAPDTAEPLLLWDRTESMDGAVCTLLALLTRDWVGDGLRSVGTGCFCFCGCGLLALVVGAGAGPSPCLPPPFLGAGALKRWDLFGGSRAFWAGCSGFCLGLAVAGTGTGCRGCELWRGGGGDAGW